MSSGFAKFIAEHAARKEKEGISRVVSTGLFFYFLFGAAIVALCWPCIDPLIELLHKLGPNRTRDVAHAAFVGDVQFLLRWGLVLFAASNCIGALSAVQTGLQRMDVTNIVGFVACAIKVVATVLFLETGYGLRGLLYANAAVFAFFGIAAVICGLRIGPGSRDINAAGQQRNRSHAVSIRLANAGVPPVKSCYVSDGQGDCPGRVQKARARGAVCHRRRVGRKMRQLPALLVTALLPRLGLDARGDSDRLRKLYIVSSKYVAAVTLPLVAFCAGSSGLLMRVWMGPTVADLDTAAW